MGYNGQWEQDRILNEEIFKGKREGTFIEIGCASPIRISNSYYFESELAWRGVCVDARKSACDEFKEVRSSKVVNAAIGVTHGKSIFLDFGLLAGIAKYMGSHEFETIEKWTKDFSKVNAYWVDVIPFSEIRKELSDGHIDLLMLDTEGAEFPILSAAGEGLKDFRVLMVEANSPDHLAAIERLVVGLGFRKYKTIGMDHIFLNQYFFNSSSI